MRRRSGPQRSFRRRRRLPEVLEESFTDATAALGLPAKYGLRLCSANMVERFIEEVRCREKVVRIFPNTQAAWRLIGALCAEQHEEWAYS